jgi:hypothetical protein
MLVDMADDEILEIAPEGFAEPPGLHLDHSVTH